MTSPDTPEPSIEQLIAEMQRAEERERRQTTDQLRDQILPQFRTLGVTSIEVAYSGCGDSGAIDGVQYRGPTGIRVDRATIPVQLIEDLECCAYSFLPAGFEINDGGQGTLTIDVQAARVVIQHQENYTDSRESTREFTL
jgi:hypothetical protein